MGKKIMQYSVIAILSMVAYSFALSVFPVRSFPIKELLAKAFSFFVCLFFLSFLHNKTGIKNIIGRAVGAAVVGAVVVSAFDGIYSATKQVVLVCILTAMFWFIAIGFFLAPIMERPLKNTLQLLCNKKCAVMILSITVFAILLMYGISAYRNISISGLLSGKNSLLSYLELLTNQPQGASMLFVDITFITIFFGMYKKQAKEIE